MTTSILSSPFLAWTRTKHSTPVRRLQQSNWTRFGTFHATCTHNALCLLLFTYAGHHNNSFAKSCFNQTVIWSWPKFDTLDHSTNAISLFWTSFFSFLRPELHFVAPESARKNNRTVGRMHRIWPDLEAPGTTPRTPKSLPVTARSSQKGTHKWPSNSLKKSTNRAPPALFSVNLLCYGLGALSKKRLRRNK